LINFITNISCTIAEVTAKTDCTEKNYRLIYIPNSGLNYCDGNTAVPITSNINLYYEIPLITVDVGVDGAMDDTLTSTSRINYPISIKGNTDKSKSIIIHLNQYFVAQYVSDEGK